MSSDFNYYAEKDNREWKVFGRWVLVIATSAAVAVAVIFGAWAGMQYIEDRHNDTRWACNEGQPARVGFSGHTRVCIEGGTYKPADLIIYED